MGQWTTIKRNAAELLRRELRPDRIIYCSPLSDPYQPAEATVRLMPDLLEAVAGNPPKVFVIQTRGPVIVRDIDLLRVLAARTDLRVSFSITADSDSVRRIFEPGCAPIWEHWKTVAALQSAGIETSVAIAPILPCDPAVLIERAVAVGFGPIVADQSWRTPFTCAPSSERAPRRATRQSQFAFATAGTNGWIPCFSGR